MNKIFAGVVAAILSLSAFNVVANTKIVEDQWQHVKNNKAMAVLNVNRAGHILSFNCERNIGAWIAFETQQGTIMLPDTDPDVLSLELLIVDSSNTLVRWTKDDLDFDKANGAGQQRVQKLFEVLHTAKSVEVLLGGEIVEKFVGTPATAFPEYKDIAGYCKV